MRAARPFPILRHPAALVAFLAGAVLGFLLFGDARGVDGSGQPTSAAHAPVHGLLEPADATGGLLRDRSAGLKLRHGDHPAASAGAGDKAHALVLHEFLLHDRPGLPRDDAAEARLTQSLKRDHFATGPPRA